LAIDTNEEWRRLQGLYAAMSDDELLELARKKAELTEVAQRAVDSEMSSRRLVVPVEENEAEQDVPELPSAKDNPSLVELTTFQIPADAERALRELDERGIPLQMEQAMRRFTEDGPLIRTNWLTIFVEAERRREAVAVLRERMGLFPLAEQETNRGADVEGDEDSLLTVGEFVAYDDVELVRKALTDAGIKFEATKESVEEYMEPGQAAVDVTTVQVRVEDLERALEVVEAAFAGAE
jgi:hypothetical protein